METTKIRTNRTHKSTPISPRTKTTPLSLPKNELTWKLDICYYPRNMEQTPLAAQKRTILGRKVKKLRKEGLIPAHVFGHKVKTEHVQVKAGEFHKVFEKVGETGIISLVI